MRPNHVLLFGASGNGPVPRKPWTPVQREPLTWLPEPRNYPLPDVSQFPRGRDLNFIRGNFSGLSIPGAPVVPGGNDANPSLVMTALLPNYPQAFQDSFLEIYAGYYTHIQFSLFHALHYGSSLDGYIDLARRAQSAGLFVDHWFLAGDDVIGGARDADVNFWRAQLDPIIPRLLGAGVVDLACVGWQLDQYNVPGNQLIAIIAYIAGALPRSIPLYTHWANEALAWWKSGGEVWSDAYQTINVVDRFTWWAAMQPYLTGGHHQGNTEAARTQTRNYQLSILDTLDYFHGRTDKGSMGLSRRRVDAGEPFRFIIAENNAQDEFDGVISEATGDATTYALLGARAYNGAYTDGYYNGTRQPNGLYV